MSRVFGEAHLDRSIKRYYYQIEADTGQVLARSDAVFASIAEAEAELIEVLQGLAEKSAMDCCGRTRT
jgi:hypothetical protein